jgi:Ca2+-transporting ATPase
LIAVKDGRVIFDNILYKVHPDGEFQKSAPFSLLLFWFTFSITSIHILWINLVDGLPGLALASEPAEGNVMKRQPRDPQQNILLERWHTYNKCWANGFGHSGHSVLGYSR